MAIEFFEINWTKLHPFEKALTQPQVKEGGVYALYKLIGSSKKLLYVGKSKDFETRFCSHKNAADHLNTTNDRKKCFVSFGLISSYEKSRMSNDITPQQLKAVENFLIVALNPIGNGDSTKKRYTSDIHAIIVNTGVVAKPLNKFMSHNPQLLTLIGKSKTVTPVTRKRKPKGLYDF
ncbi:MAG: GIY-YIG nuclease family protein [Dehalococcoidales bacterium]|nr:GIY-YIG nuclease family protein [Dehalococcoidales bacterium]